MIGDIRSRSFAAFSHPNAAGGYPDTLYVRIGLAVYGAHAGFSRSNEVAPQRSQLASLGWLILFTTIVSASCVGAAILTVTGVPVLAAAFGVFALLAIIGVERAVMHSVARHNSDIASRLTAALPRVAISAALALLLYMPVHVFLLRGEVRDRWRVERAQRALQFRSELEMNFGQAHDTEVRKLRELNQQLDDARRRVQQYRDRADRERDGQVAGRPPIMGPNWREDKRNEIIAEAELTELRRRLQPEIDKLDAQLIAAQQRLVDEPTKKSQLREERLPFFTQLSVFRTLVREDPSREWVSRFLFMAIVLLDILPILLKITLGNGPYEELVRNHESLVRESEAFVAGVQSDSLVEERDREAQWRERVRDHENRLFDESWTQGTALTDWRATGERYVKSILARLDSRFDSEIHPSEGRRRRTRRAPRQL